MGNDEERWCCGAGGQQSQNLQCLIHLLCCSPAGGLLPLSLRRRVATAGESGSSAASVGSGWMDMPESQPPAAAPLQVFPRLKERDPYRRLGVSREASFEEVQEARNFLVEQVWRRGPPAHAAPAPSCCPCRCHGLAGCLPAWR